MIAEWQGGNAKKKQKVGCRYAPQIMKLKDPAAPRCYRQGGPVMLAHGLNGHPAIDLYRCS